MRNRKVFSMMRACVSCVVMLGLTFCLGGCSFVLESSAPKLGEAKLTTPSISENGVLKVGVNTSQSPLAGVGNSKIIGIDVDIAAALADSLGLELKIIDTGSTPSKSISNGEVDIAFGVDKSDAPNSVTLTDSYIPTAVVYFKKAGATPTSLTGETAPKIGAQGSSKSAWSATNAFGTEAVASSADLAGAFQALEAGTVEYVVADAVIGMYAANKANVNVEIVALGTDASGYCVAISENNTSLVSDISTALIKLVDDGTVSTIEKKWLGRTVDLGTASKIDKKASSSSNSADSSSSSSSGRSSTGSTLGTTATDANSVG